MQHLEKMAELKQESEMLKQLTEIERMKKELQELRGEKTSIAETGTKQVNRNDTPDPFQGLHLTKHV